MALLIVNTLGLTPKEHERIEYLATLDECPIERIDSLADSRAPHPDQDCLIVLKAQTPEGLKKALEGREGRHHFVLMTPTIAEVFTSEESFNDFFQQGGLCIFQDGWSDLAFRNLVNHAALTNSHFDDLALPFVTLVSLSQGGKTFYGYSHELRRRGATISFIGRPDLSEAASSFTIPLQPGVVLHGHCRIHNNPSSPQAGVWRCEVEFTEFDGVSRNHLYAFLSSGFSCQTQYRKDGTKTFADHLEFVRELARPVSEALSIDFRISSGAFDTSLTDAVQPWLTSLLLSWILTILNGREIQQQTDWVQLGVHETGTGYLAVFLTIPLPNRLTLRLNSWGVLEGFSLIRTLLKPEQIDLLHIHGVQLEQYPEEPFEHLAICLESR